MYGTISTDPTLCSTASGGLAVNFQQFAFGLRHASRGTHQEARQLMLQRVADRGILRLFALVFNCAVTVLKIARNGHRTGELEREPRFARVTEPEGLSAESVLPF